MGDGVWRIHHPSDDYDYSRLFKKKTSRQSFRISTFFLYAPDHLRLLRILVKRKTGVKTLLMCPQIRKLKQLFFFK